MRFIITILILLLELSNVSSYCINDSLKYKIEMNSSFSNNSTPLWLNANKYGLSSLDKNNGYIRYAMIKDLESNRLKKFDLSYGIDFAVPYNYTSKFIIQQAFIEGRWLHGTLSVGSKEYKMDLKNNSLSSGSQTLGINARPVPQIRIALPEFYTLPIFNRFIHVKGHIAFGKMTDSKWQKEFTDKTSKYSEGTLYHSKAGYLKFGREESPFSLYAGLEMASIFGGDIYRPKGDGTMEKISSRRNLKAFWNAFIPGGSDSNETTYQNVEGDQLGSWILRANYENKDVNIGVYWDHFFEDHSGMFFLDYNGYGKGDEWDSKKDNKFLLYDLKDMLLGIEINFKHSKLISNLVFEYIYTKYQSGPVYHDHTPDISDHIGGMDNYYNHDLFTGWQHWGQVMGNPLFRSPIYNEDGTINVDNNRFYAFHLGMDGNPTKNISWRTLCTIQKGFGSYQKPFITPDINYSFLLEATLKLQQKLRGWNIKMAYGMDFGKIYGDNLGLQITLSKIGIF